MYCNNCGKEVPDGSNFCNHCGKPVGQISPPEEEVFWEHCQIVWTYEKEHPLTNNYKNCFFWASATGRQGSYNAGSSSKYDLSNWERRHYDVPFGYSDQIKKISSKAHAELVKKLINDGWEPVPNSGDTPWMLQFKRRAK